MDGMIAWDEKCPACGKNCLKMFTKDAKIKRIKHVGNETVVTTKWETFIVSMCGKCGYYHDGSEDV